MRVKRLMGALALSALALGCGNDDNGTDPGEHLNIAIVSGTGQTQIVGRALTTPFVAKVTTVSGAPVSGHTVNWTVATGGGTLSAASSITDADGLASTTLTVGPTEMTNTVTATLDGQPSATVSFTASGKWETFGSDMLGANESPALTNSANVTATYKLLSANSMSYEVAGSGLTGTWTGLHIHGTCCATGATTAPVIVNLCPAGANCSISGGIFSTTGTFASANIATTWYPTATEQQRFDSLLFLMRKGDGSLYTNIHTSINTGGQARGAVAPRPLP